MLLVSTVYFISAKIVAPLSMVESESVFAIWPPTGIALASLYIFGYRAWIGIFLGALALNMTLTPFFPSLQIAITNTLGPLFGFLFLQKYDKQNIFNTTKAMALFFLSILIASVITASGGSFALWIHGFVLPVAIYDIFFGWFLGDLIGFLLVGTIVEAVRSDNISIKRLLSVEGLLMVGTLIVTNLIIFGPFAFFDLIDYPVVYFLFPPLIWATLRFGQVVAVVSLLIVSLNAIYGTILGYGPFLRDDPQQSLLLLQSFTGMLAVTILLIAAIFNESEKAQKELKENEKNLVRKIQEGIEKHELQNRQLQQQSRLAQMGEMISMIAHQWRQPLGAIASTSIDIKMKSALEMFDLRKEKEAREYETYVNKGLEKIDNFVQNLTSTIDDFRNFYKPNKKIVTTTLEDVVIKSLIIIKASLESENIKIIQEYNYNEKVELYDSELMQVILNILKNAQDNIKEKQIKDPYIKISTENKTISICDNGGGIPEDIIENIFDPYFTTKHEKNGTGLGLYMSKTIVEEHHGGRLSVENTEDGVCFIIACKK